MARVQRVHLVIAVISGLGAFVAVTMVRTGWTDGSPFSSAQFWLFTGFVLLGEARPIHAPLRGERLEYTTSTTFVFALLFALGTPEASLAIVGAMVAADVFFRKVWWKTAFNASLVLLSMRSAGAVFDALGGVGAEGESFSRPADLLVAGAAGLAFFMVNSTVGYLPLGMSEGVPLRTMLRDHFAYQFVAEAGLLALSPIVVIAAQRNLVFIPLLLIPLAVVHKSAKVSVEKEHQSLHDQLTNLPNRELFQDRSLQATLAAKRGGTTAALMLIDLDRFKEVNDVLGHHMGDRLLQGIAVRLEKALRETDTVARLGGDEFGVVLYDLPDPTSASEVADKLLTAIQEPFDFDGLLLDVSASIGIALYPDHGEDPETLLQRADIAMYAAKSARGGRATYTISHDRASPLRLALAGELRRAIDEGQLVLHYQPKIEVRTGRMIGAEALVRWHHPTRGFLAPEEFIPFAEQTGHIRNLTAWVLTEAVKQCRRWQDQGHDIGVAVNVSARDLHDTTLPGMVGRLLADSGLDPSYLDLEITESMVMLDPDRSQRVLGELRLLGVDLALDDYGTGHSALAQLRQLPVTELKIDKSFILRMVDHESDAVIASSTIDLGRRLGLRVVAEGVETAELWHRLQAMGCDVAQGNYLSAPVLPGDLADVLLRFPAEQRVASPAPLV